MQRANISIVGAGNVAQALAPELVRAGYRLEEIIARAAPDSVRRAQSLARKVHARVAKLDQSLLESRIVLVCVSDDAILPSARLLARLGGWSGKVVLHCSGARSSEELAPLRKAGAAVGSLHPMMTFVAGVQPSMAGVPFAVEGDPAAVRVARRMALDLGGTVFSIAKEAKPLYHAVGSFCSPMIVFTLVTAERVARAAGIPESKIGAVMHPILQRTINNYLRSGPAAAFSGPIQRADLETIRLHLDALKAVPGAREVYLALARSALPSLPVRDRSAVEKLLEGKRQKQKGKKKTLSTEN
jgi:predicted short-subunit dehydrogenase-like oxidoreductase (DUF2520 family)